MSDNESDEQQADELTKQIASSLMQRQTLSDDDDELDNESLNHLASSLTPNDLHSLSQALISSQMAADMGFVGNNPAQQQQLSQQQQQLSQLQQQQHMSQSQATARTASQQQQPPQLTPSVWQLQQQQPQQQPPSYESSLSSPRTPTAAAACTEQRLLPQ